MRDWIPVPGTTKDRLVRSALELFGQAAYESVSVHDLAERAGVTTGSLYHHFGGKPELYALVRTDVERRVADRVEAAIETGATLGAALIGGFDWVVRSGFARLVGASLVGAGADDLHRVVMDASDAPTAIITLAAWRAALAAVAPDATATDAFRAALIRVLAA